MAQVTDTVERRHEEAVTKGDGNGKHHLVTFFVDDEAHQTDRKTLTVREIIALEEDTPEQFCLEELHGQSGQKKRYDDPNQEIHIHENQRFVTLFCGPTPVS